MDVCPNVCERLLACMSSVDVYVGMGTTHSLCLATFITGGERPFVPLELAAPHCVAVKNIDVLFSAHQPSLEDLGQPPSDQTKK
mmetsp:Transcript_6979/g.12154  ORF Transcript_6979/g.12154 Transcript_6979/m.12154 type:complete len:84 (-) Transcript_6979:392-643(-)